MAFVRYDGAGPRVASIYVQILQNYGPEYPSMQGLTFHGWEQDRWLFPALSWSEWQAITLDMRARITDEIIEKAIAAQPREFVELDGERLRKDLRGRRDRLVEGARSFYEHLAGEVNVQATDTAEQITVTRNSDGSMLVELREIDRTIDGKIATSEPFFSRRFEPDDTKEVRIYLREGDDQVEVVGEHARIRLKVISGGFTDAATKGRKRVDHSQGGKHQDLRRDRHRRSRAGSGNPCRAESLCGAQSERDLRRRKGHPAARLGARSHPYSTIRL